MNLILKLETTSLHIVLLILLIFEYLKSIHVNNSVLTQVERC